MAIASAFPPLHQFQPLAPFALALMTMVSSPLPELMELLRQRQSKYFPLYPAPTVGTGAGVNDDGVITAAGADGAVADSDSFSISAPPAPTVGTGAGVNDDGVITAARADRAVFDAHGKGAAIPQPRIIAIARARVDKKVVVATR